MKIIGIALISCLIQSAAAQTAMPGSIHGVAVNSGTQYPIAQAVVELRSASDTTGTPVAITATKQNGEFTFPAVPPGRYRLAVTRAGYAPAMSLPIAVTAQQVTDTKITLAAGAAISGRVTYANGEPLPSALVAISKLGYTDDGRPKLTVVQNGFTDDLGEYRLFWLAPGSYYLSVVNENYVSAQITLNPLGNGSQNWTGGGGSRTTAHISRPLGLEEGQTYGTLYYPGTSDLNRATPLELLAGAELKNINVNYVPSVTPNISIRGVAVDSANGRPAQGTIVGTLRQLETSAAGFVSALQFNPNNGAFVFTGVGPGSYELRLSANGISGRVVAEIHDHDIDVEVPLYPPVNVSGKLSLDGSGASDGVDWTGLRVRTGGSASQPGVLVAANGEFTIPSLAAATYDIEVLMPLSWPDAYVKSIRMHNSELPNNQLVLDGTPPAPVEVVVHRSGGSIDGRVFNARQEIIPNASVVLVPDQSGALRPDQFRTTSTDESGRFQFHALPAGEYSVYAWEDIEKNAWFGPGFIQMFGSYKQTVHVVDAQNQRVDVVSAPAD